MSSAPAHYPLVKLPHPFLTSYRVQRVPANPQHLTLTHDAQPTTGRAPPQPLHSSALTFLDLTHLPATDQPPLNENTPWARARRTAHTTIQWPASSSSPPALGPVWNIVHAIYLAHPTAEAFRLTLAGPGSATVRGELLASGLAVEHPAPKFGEKSGAATPTVGAGELLVLRAAFWQGAASPTGPRPIWVVGDGVSGEGRADRAQMPPMPELYTLTNKFPAEPVYTRHPVRQPKPAPGAIVYSRWVPEAGCHFSLEVVDWESAEHVKLFNVWQNDPRVSAGWNETGTVDEHREYLRRLHVDPHVLCLYGRFDETRFAYFELYWAKVCVFIFASAFVLLLSLTKTKQEDHYGAHYAAHDYDRGRHSLVGDASFRGAMRVNAWYSSCIHYCFLDDVRTVNVVGEPKAAGATILSYENAQGLTIGKYVDFAHKRSVHSVASREKWFQLCPIFWDKREKPLESADRAAWNAKL